MRTFLVVIDSFGIGAMPDAEKFGDIGSAVWSSHESITQTYSKVWPGWEMITGLSVGLRRLSLDRFSARSIMLKQCPQNYLF